MESQSPTHHAEVISSLRRPATTNHLDFWYCDPEEWDSRLLDAAHPDGKTRSMQYLRRFDAAGRIMETSEGYAAPRACSVCVEIGKYPCMVYKYRIQKACAFCRLFGRVGCTVGPAFNSEAEYNIKKIKELKARLEAVEGKAAALEGQVEELKAKLEAVEGRAECMEMELQGWKVWVDGVLGQAEEQEAGYGYA